MIAQREIIKLITLNLYIDIPFFILRYFLEFTIRFSESAKSTLSDLELDFLFELFCYLSFFSRMHYLRVRLHHRRHRHMHHHRRLHQLQHLLWRQDRSRTRCQAQNSHLKNIGSPGLYHLCF